MRIKYLSVVGISVLVLAFALNSSAAVIGNLSIVPTTVNQRQAIAVSGTCSQTAASIMVDVTVSNGSSVLRSTPTASASGSFVTVVSIPDVYPSGTAQVQALCANGDTLVGSVQINPAIGLLLVVSDTGTLGQPFAISGTCGTNPNGSGVIFNITQNGITTSLGNTTTTGGSGNFATSVNFGSSLVAGPAVITAICPGGSSVSSAINLVNTPPPAPIADVGGTNEGGTGGTGATTEVSSTTPVGGVAAGMAGLNLITVLGAVLMLAGIVGLAYSERRLVIN